MQQLGQAPERGQSGSTLNKGSTPGSRVNFIGSTSIGTGTLVLSAGGTGGITANTSIWDPLLPTSARNNNNLKSWNDAVVWSYFDIFVDVDNNFNYEFGGGASLSSGQKNITMSKFQNISPVVNKTHTVNFFFKNNDSSEHTIYFYLGGKYAITG